MSDYVTTWRHIINWTEYLNTVQYQCLLLLSVRLKLTPLMYALKLLYDPRFWQEICV